MSKDSLPRRLYATTILCLSSVALSVGVLFGSDIVAALCFVLYYKAAGLSSNDTSSLLNGSISAQFVFALLSALIAIVTLFVYAKKKHMSLRYFGINSFRVRYFAIVFGYMLLYLVSFLVVANIVRAVFPFVNQGQKQDIGFDTASNLIHYGLMFLLIVIIIPIKEEILFRGFLFTKLRERTPFIISALIVSLVFGALHLELFGHNPLNWMAAIDTCILSLFLCRIKESSKSLWPSILLHMAKNGVAFSVLFGEQIRLLIQR